MRLRIVASVGQQLFRPFLALASFASGFEFGNGFDQRFELGDVVAVGACDFDRQRQPMPLGQGVMFGAWLGAVCRIWPGVISALSGAHRRGIDHSSLPVELSLRFQLLQDECVKLLPYARLLPLVQLFPRRHAAASAAQRAPAWGTSSHGIPVLRTNKITLKATRLSTGLRPEN